MQGDTTIRLATGDHVVYCYEDDDDLVAIVVRYVGSALDRGEAAVVVVTPEHARRFTEDFARAGIDSAAAEAASRLILLDAARTLANVAPDGTIDPAAFEATVTPLLCRARAAGGHVCLYGEMVALLFEQGRPDSALRLEECWNELGSEEGFSLLCAYPAPRFSDAAREDADARIGRLHSDVVADQPRPDDAETTCGFARGPDAPRQARRFVTDVLVQWELDDLVDFANLIVTELATNAIVHARSGFSVSLNHD